MGKKDDIFFFDFSDFSGAILLASHLREQNLMASWVYMEGTSENLYRALYAQPSAYVGDAVNEKEVLTTLRQLVQRSLQMQKKYYFCFKLEGEYLRIPFEEISYFESNAKKVTLHQVKSDKCYFFTAKLDDISKQLSSDFIRCHQSYLVNMQEIRCLDIKNHLFRLRSNEEIMISRRSYKETKEKYEQFLTGWSTRKYDTVFT
ncbi:MAG: LytTR family transcriptional regulator DNA-binding domain-containing protein [Acetatifactor sp.]|nr:LytTR family transcriptional regulator DNA-binding domain-containing protein [Acetatifactor sp.]